MKLKMEHMVLLEKLNHLVQQYCCKVDIKKLVQEIKSLLDSTPNGQNSMIQGKKCAKCYVNFRQEQSRCFRNLIVLEKFIIPFLARNKAESSCPLKIKQFWYYSESVAQKVVSSISFRPLKTIDGSLARM